MCIQEYIAYQCGHRTPGVVRPCPLTTAGHNFPVCTIQPSKQHLAQTMCGPCERLLHSRWVLIREWEHRWLHERGVCGCDVVFPGLLTRPRVIGNVSDSEEEEDVTERGSGDTIGHYGFAPGDTAEAEEAQQGQGRTGGSHHHIPPIFTETTVAGDQQRVAIRLPSLYAAEWLADHRALHDSGRCQCPVQFAPFQPAMGEYDMSAEEREFLEEYRQNENRTRAINESEGVIALRMAQINDTFGPFNPAAATAASSAPAKPTPVSDLPPPTGPRRARAASHHYQSQNHGLYHQQFHQGQVGHQNNQPRYSPSSTLATNTSVPFPQGQSFDTVPQYHQQQQSLFGLADQMIQLPISTAQGGGHSYSGPSNYNNNKNNNNEHVYGPNTFVPMGIVFPDDHTHTNQSEAKGGQGQHHQQHQELRSLTSSLPPPSLLPFPGNPYCGLPVGSGPEGSEVHMPTWEECPLRRCRSSVAGAGPRVGVFPSEIEIETEEIGAETNTGDGDGNDAESGCGTQLAGLAEQQHRTGGLGGGHQRSSSYS